MSHSAPILISAMIVLQLHACMHIIWGYECAMSSSFTCFCHISESKICLFLFHSLEENTENRGLHINFHCPYCWVVEVLDNLGLVDVIDDSAEQRRTVFWIKHICAVKCKEQNTRFLDYVHCKYEVLLKCLAMCAHMHTTRSTCSYSIDVIPYDELNW